MRTHRELGSLIIWPLNSSLLRAATKWPSGQEVRKEIVLVSVPLKSKASKIERSKLFKLSLGIAADSIWDVESNTPKLSNTSKL